MTMTTLVANQKIVDRDLFDLFISYLDASPTTVETYTKSLRQFFNFLNCYRIKHPGREDILAFRDKLKEKGTKPTTIQNYINAIKIFFKWTSQEGLYPDIADHIKGAKIDKDHKKDYLTSRQVKEILNSIDTSTEKGARDYSILLLMVTGGLRDIEISRANVKDIRNLGDNTVLYVQGKGKEEKNDYVKLPDNVEKSIRLYLQKRTKDENSPLFCSTSNNNRGERLTTRSISGIVKSRLRNVGYDSSRLTAHSLRHTAITLSLLAGRSLDEVQQFARHSNISTTMIYNHALDKSKNGCSDAISKSIFE